MINPINSRQDPIAVFIHVPKTAGTTLNLIIERQYNPQNIISIQTPQENLETVNKFRSDRAIYDRKIKAIKGHTFLGWHELLSQPCVYFTLLRDPVERFISNYFFLLRKKGHPLGQKLVEQQVSLEDFVGWSGEDNYQTRFLAKNINEANFDIKQNECTRQTFELAKNNLKSHFAVVGTVEEFDQTLMLIKKNFGWNNIFYKVKNKNQQRLPKSSIPQSTLALIKEANKFDLELYQYANETLSTLVQEQGDSFAKEVENFREINCSKLGQFSAWISSSTNKVQKIITPS